MYRIEVAIFIISLIIIIGANIGKRTFQKMMIEYTLSVLTALIALYILFNSFNLRDIIFVVAAIMILLRVILKTIRNE